MDRTDDHVTPPAAARTGSPQVSVVIPTHDSAAFVGKAIDSALAQTCRPIEIICVDDGSADATLQILERFASRHPAVKVITQANQGANAARNAGLVAAQGEWIQFLDADDVLEPDKVEQQLAVAAERPSVDVIVGAFVRGDESRTSPKLDGIKEISDPWLALVRGWLGITSANLWRREAVVRAGGWSPTQRSSQEYELMFRLLQNDAEFALCAEVGTIVRSRDGSVSRSDSARRVWLDLRADVAEYLRHSDLWTDARRIAIARYLIEQVKGRVLSDFSHAITLHGRIFGLDNWATYEANPVRRLAYQTFGFERTERMIQRARRTRVAGLRKRAEI